MFSRLFWDEAFSKLSAVFVTSHNFGIRYALQLLRLKGMPEKQVHAWTIMKGGGGLDPNNDQIPSGPHCIQLGRCCATPWGCSYDGSSVSDLSPFQRHKKRKIHIQKSRRNATQNPWIDVYITITTKGVNRIGEEKRSVRV